MTDVRDRVSQSKPDAATKKTTMVRVLASPLDESPWASFSMVADYKDKGGEQDGEKLKFDARAGPFDLSFELDDQSGLHLAFCDPFEDAMWVAVGEKCPGKAGNGQGAITSGTRESDTRLVMTNTNDIRQGLTFMLRFTGDQRDKAHPPYEYDPRIINGGHL